MDTTDLKKGFLYSFSLTGSLLVSFGVCWFLLVSVVVLNCPEIPGEGDCEHMGEVCVCLWGLDVCKGVLENSGLVWCKKCSILEMLERQNLTLLKHQSIIVLSIVIPSSISNRRASFMDSYSRSTRLLFSVQSWFPQHRSNSSL